jgi:hypothetical protein
MYLINKLCGPGEVRSIKITPNEVVIKMKDENVVVYERKEVEHVPVTGEESHRLSALH